MSCVVVAYASACIANRIFLVWQCTVLIESAFKMNIILDINVSLDVFTLQDKLH